MQRMPIPMQTKQNENPEVIFKMYVLAPYLIGVFSVSLLAEASRASKEKFLGVHVIKIKSFFINISIVQKSLLL